MPQKFWEKIGIINTLKTLPRTKINSLYDNNIVENVMNPTGQQ